MEQKKNNTLIFDESHPYLCIGSQMQGAISQKPSSLLSLKLIEVKKQLQQKQQAVGIDINERPKSQQMQNEDFRIAALRRLSCEKDKRLSFVKLKAERLLILERIKQAKFKQRGLVGLQKPIQEIQQQLAIKSSDQDHILAKRVRQDKIKRIFEDSRQLHSGSETDLKFTLTQLQNEQREEQNLQERVLRLKNIQQQRSEEAKSRNGQTRNLNPLSRQRTARLNEDLLTNSPDQSFQFDFGSSQLTRQNTAQVDCKRLTYAPVVTEYFQNEPIYQLDVKKNSMNQTWTECSKSPYKNDYGISVTNMTQSKFNVSQQPSQRNVAISEDQHLSRLEKLVKTQNDWKESMGNIAVLDRPIDRGVKRQYETLLTRQKLGAFKNLKSDNSSIMQAAMMDRRRASESNKMTSRIKYYDTSRIGSGSGEMSLNRFI